MWRGRRFQSERRESARKRASLTVFPGACDSLDRPSNVEAIRLSFVCELGRDERPGGSPTAAGSSGQTSDCKAPGSSAREAARGCSARKATRGCSASKASGRSAYRPRPRFGGAQLSSGRGGRMRMEFTPGRR